MKGSHMSSNLSSDRTGEQQNLNKTESATLFALVPIPLESVHFRLLITWTNKVTLLKHALRSVLRYMDENRIGLTWENVSSRSFIFTFHHCCDLACNAKVFSQVWLNLLLGKMNHLTWEDILLSSFTFTFHHCCDLACNAKVFSQVWPNLLLGIYEFMN